MVAAAPDERRGQAMIRAILRLAAELNVEVVAEGVETEDQRAALVRMGSKTRGQGFYFSQPIDGRGYDEEPALRGRTVAGLFGQCAKLISTKLFRRACNRG
jgi:EAL domain-containing protein (putative c-di-GMP-specific phosphodiesterase class I)